MAVAASAAEGERERGGEVVVYQYKICPFCNKVKGLLRLFDEPFTIVEVNPLGKKQIAFSAEYRKVPIAMIDGEQVNDSPVIVDALLRRLQTRAQRGNDADALERLRHFASPEGRKWAEWADKRLAVLLFPNITRNFGESYEAFSYVRDVESFALWEKASNQIVGATAMWLAQGKIKKKYGIEDERTALAEAITEWAQELQGKDFSGGTLPNLGDVAVFGCLRAIEGLQTFSDVMRDAAVCAWYDRMAAAVERRGPIQ